MWRRASISLIRSSSLLRRSVGSDLIPEVRAFSSGGGGVFRRTSPLFSSDNGGAPVKKTVEDVMPIATGFEKEEIAYELEGKQRFDMEPPVGPFGTKEAPAVIESYYDKRIIGCPGGEGEDEHDVIWFWLEKEKPHECPVCSQYFVLKVIGDGGDPIGHSDDEDEHHHH